jgi:uncharacterized membrane protein YphA (DoxX/SURF4 family)
VQRPYSRFPDGAAGIGLLLLRTTVGAGALGHGVAHLLNTTSTATPITWLADGVVIVTGIAVLAGLFTLRTAALLGIALMLSRFPEQSRASILESPATLLVIANAIALTLLGPGAFSIDARLFGHREIVIRRDTMPPRE